jgi:hypothetical protein
MMPPLTVLPSWQLSAWQQLQQQASTLTVQPLPLVLDLHTPQCRQQQQPTKGSRGTWVLEHQV